jgi:hypothetical protein
VVGIEAVDGLDEAEASDLDEVIERLASIHEPARDVARDPEVVLDQLVAQARVTGVPIAREALVGLPFGLSLLAHALPQLARGERCEDAVSSRDE